jgi:hypothetical protein
VAFGAASLIAPSAGTYTLKISPAPRVLAALRKGKTLFVAISVTFQNRAGGAPVTHARRVLVKIKKRPRGHR